MVEMRERLERAAAGLQRSLSHDLGRDGLSEIVVVSTCNRLEVYAIASGLRAGVEEAVVGRLSEAASLPLSGLEPLLYRKAGREAVVHLLRVACGLDSQMLGETQILGQVSECLGSARAEGTLGPVLTYLFSRAVHAGRRARTETAISQGGMSIGHAAASLLAEELGGLSGRRVVIVGAGETAEMAVQALRNRGQPQVTCVGRSLGRAEALAAAAGCVALPWSALGEALADADAVITATSAPHPILYAEDVIPALAQRRARPLLLLDIAVPRDIDPAVGRLPLVTLYDIDCLEASLDEGRARREAAIPRVEDIIAAEADIAMEWIGGRKVAPLVRELRRRARSIADAEACRAVSRSGELSPEQQEVVRQMARRIANKLLHEPTLRVKARANEADDQGRLEAFADLFGLENETER
jgi:glutamyl-tRNA reductase